MKVLVIGGTGFIGPEVVRLLVAADHAVAVFHRGEREAALPAAVRHVHDDRDRLPEHRDGFAHLGPDVVLLMSALTERHATLALEALRGIARRVVAVSSADVYRAYGRMHGTEPGPPDPTPLAEDAPLRERLYPYRGRGLGLPQEDDYDKIPVERAVLGDRAFAGTVLRLTLVHGPRSYRYNDYVRRMFDGRPAILLGDALARFRGTRAYVDDVARAIVLAVTDDHARGRIFNVGEPDGLAEADWVRAIADVVGWRGAVVSVDPARVPEALRPRLPFHLTEREDHGQDLVLDTSRIRRELGYAERVTREEGLVRTVAWLRANASSTTHGLAQPFDYEAEDLLLRRVREA